MKKTGKRFDCVAMKHAIQLRIYEETRDLSPEEEIAYFRRQAETGPLGNFYRSLLEKSR